MFTNKDRNKSKYKKLGQILITIPSLNKQIL